MLAVAMVAAISVTMFAAPSATAAEGKRNVHFIGSTHNNADPSLTPYDGYSSLFSAVASESITATQLASFGADPRIPLILALSIDDAVDFDYPEDFLLDEVFWDDVKGVYSEIATDVAIAVYDNSDPSYDYLRDNELAITLETTSSVTGYLFDPGAYYRLSFEFNGDNELFVFKIKMPSQGQQNNLVFNVGGIIMKPDDVEILATVDRLLYNFTNDIPDITQYDVNNLPYIQVLCDGQELQGAAYTVDFHYQGFDQLVAIEFPSALDLATSEYEVIFKADNGSDDGSGGYGLSANNGNRLINQVDAVFGNVW